MTDLCLTHTDGTTMLGLYRGLKLKTDGTPWKVAVFTAPAADLRNQPLPAIVTIHATGVPIGILGSGNRHAVVVFRFFDATHLQVGEPFTGGRQWWTVKQFEQVYDGSGIWLFPLSMYSGRGPG